MEKPGHELSEAPKGLPKEATAAESAIKKGVIGKREKPRVIKVERQNDEGQVVVKNLDDEPGQDWGF